MRTSRLPRRTRIATPEDLGTTLRLLRRARGLSQQEVADWLGVSRPYIVKLEQGLVVQQVDRVFALLGILGADLEIAPRDG